MKIKTICESTRWQSEFDNQVNEALEKGWQLARRDIIPGSPNDSNNLYAELVLLDPPAEPEPVDPFQALRQVQDFCEAQENCYNCPITGWCEKLALGGDPTDWDLPEVVPF